MQNTATGIPKRDIQTAPDRLIKTASEEIHLDTHSATYWKTGRIIKSAKNYRIRAA
jgi:hypothetical protein